MAYILFILPKGKYGVDFGHDIFSTMYLTEVFKILNLNLLLCYWRCIVIDSHTHGVLFLKQGIILGNKANLCTTLTAYYSRVVPGEFFLPQITTLHPIAPRESELGLNIVSIANSLSSASVTAVLSATLCFIGHI